MPSSSFSVRNLLGLSPKDDCPTQQSPSPPPERNRPEQSSETPASRHNDCSVDADSPEVTQRTPPAVDHPVTGLALQSAPAENKGRWQSKDGNSTTGSSSSSSGALADVSSNFDEAETDESSIYATESSVEISKNDGATSGGGSSSTSCPISDSTTASTTTNSTPDSACKESLQEITNRASHQTSSRTSRTYSTPMTHGRGQRRQRTQYSSADLQVLEEAFQRESYPGIALREELAQKLHVSEARIQVWFQNRRSRSRKTRGRAGISSSAALSSSSSTQTASTSAQSSSGSASVLSSDNTPPSSSSSSSRSKRSRKRGTSVTFDTGRPGKMQRREEGEGGKQGEGGKDTGSSVEAAKGINSEEFSVQPRHKYGEAAESRNPDLARVQPQHSAQQPLERSQGSGPVPAFARPWEGTGPVSANDESNAGSLPRSAAHVRGGSREGTCGNVSARSEMRTPSPPLPVMGPVRNYPMAFGPNHMNAPGFFGQVPHPQWNPMSLTSQQFMFLQQQRQQLSPFYYQANARGVAPSVNSLSPVLQSAQGSAFLPGHFENGYLNPLLFWHPAANCVPLHSTPRLASTPVTANNLSDQMRPSHSEDRSGLPAVFDTTPIRYCQGTSPVVLPQPLGGRSPSMFSSVSREARSFSSSPSTSQVTSRNSSSRSVSYESGSFSQDGLTTTTESSGVSSQTSTSTESASQLESRENDVPTESRVDEGDEKGEEEEEEEEEEIDLVNV